jgi:hypothetical protein
LPESVRAGGGVGLASEEERDGCDGEHDADDGERVEGEHELPPDDLAQFDDRLMLGRGWVGHSVAVPTAPPRYAG